MLLIFGYLTFAIVAGIIASSRGRSGLGYFLLSLVVSPLIGIILAVALPSRRAAIEREAELANSRPCPHCAEPIKRAASVCRFCGRDVEPIVIRRGAPPDSQAKPWPEIVIACASFAAIAIFLYFVLRDPPRDPGTPAPKESRIQASVPPMLPPAAPFVDAPIASSPKALPKDAKPKAPAGPLRIAPQ